MPRRLNAMTERQVGIYCVNLEITLIAASCVNVPDNAIGITSTAVIKIAATGVPFSVFFAIFPMP